MLPRWRVMKSHDLIGPWCLGVGVVLLLVGQRAFAHRDHGGLALALWAAGVLMVVAPHLTFAADGRRSTPPSDGRPPRRLVSRRVLVPAGAALACAALVWTVQRSRPVSEPRADIVTLWLASMVFAVFALWPPTISWRERIVAWSAHRKTELFVVAGITAGSAGLMLFRLDEYPVTMGGDEGSFAVLSRAVLRGEVPNVFVDGYSGHPMIWNYLQATFMSVFGDDVAGARVLAALGGAACVPVMYVLARRLTGRASVAIGAAALLATFHVHLFWSRSAFPNSWTSWFALVVLVLLDRSLVSGRPVALLVTGIATGLGQYLYFANRVLLLVVPVVLVVTALADRSLGVRRTVALTFSRIALVACGFLLAVLPQVAYYTVTPGHLNSRADTVSIFKSGWLDTEVAATGRSRPAILLDQFVDAAMIPFRTELHLHYRQPPPYVGWPLALMAAIGLGIVTLRALRPAYAGLAAIYWLSAAGIATTVPHSSSRWTTMMPLVCLFAAVGLDFVVRSAGTHRLVGGRAAHALVVLGVVWASAWSLHRYFERPNQPDVYSDGNTEVAERLAHFINATDPHATVYFSGAPRMYYTGFQNLVFRTPYVTSIDVPEPWSDGDSPPPVDGTTIFVLFPDRSVELATLERWYPDGTQEIVDDQARSPLFVAYVVR